jgi:TonB-linked SusC/RagA family outer membrane protein
MKKLILSLFILLGISMTAFSQERVVTGTVKSSEDGLPIPGASVKVKEMPNVGTTSDADGRFSLKVPATAKSILISYLGFSSKEAVIGSGPINVSLETSANTLSDVVITGYGAVSRKTYAGASSTISANEVAKQTFGSFDQALQGAAAGVSVVANGGQPGQNAVVRIRGNGSISGSNTPLFIMDGIEISAADFQTMNQGDFESLEILKDAVSTSVYGSRGANGVVVITTKKGKAGQVQINYDTQVGQSKMPEDRLVVMNSQQKIDYEVNIRDNPYGWTAAEADEKRAVNFNWRDALFHTANTQQHQISANGGSENSKFYASLSYLDQEGILQTTGLKRYTARASVDNVVNNFKFGVGVQGGFSRRSNTFEGDAFVSSPLNAVRWSNPWETAYNPDGSFNQGVSAGVPNGRLSSGQPNAMMELLLNKNVGRQLKGLATTYLEYNIPAVDGLYLRTNWGIDYTQNERDEFTSPLTTVAFAKNGSLTRGMSRNFRYTGTTSLNYNNGFGKHQIGGGLFFEVIKNDARSFNFTGYGFTNGFKNEAGITPGSATNANYIPLVGGTGGQNGLMSIFALANYGYDNKYFVNLAVRRDGSSKFGTGNRWANFGSIGAAWSISEEDFLKDVAFISSLKLRASYGSTGNNATNNYPLDQFAAATYAGVGGFSPNVAGNPFLTWETNLSSNIGLDFGILKNRINGTIEVYNRKTKDLFFNVPVDPAAGGFIEIPSNFGSLRNRGVELTLNGDVFRSTTGFNWSLGANITYNKNQILELPSDNTLSSDGVSILSVGSPINTLFLVPFAGVDPSNGHALYRKLDGTITDMFDSADKVKFGTSDAPWMGGFSTRLSYKGFDLSAQLNFFSGRQMYNSELTNITNPDYYYDNLHVSLLNEWTPTNTITDVPSSDLSGNNTFETETSRFIDNASFWRLRNVTLGYTIPKASLAKIGVRAARIFVQGQNIWTSTKFRGFDPEATGTILQGQYPSLVQGSIGLSIGF